MQDPARLRRELERIREDVAREQERHIRALAELRIREVRAEAALAHLSQSTKISTMTSTSPSRGAAISAARSTLGTRFQAALQARGVSLPEWVSSKGRRGPGIEQARSWSKPRANGGRAIPRAWADAIAEEFGDPALALAASWPSGIRD